MPHSLGNGAGEAMDGHSGHASAEALSTYTIVCCIVRHIEHDLAFLGRARRQASIAQLAILSKAWLKPVNECLYRNPYFGVAERAQALHQSLLLPASSERREYVKKLIFGEGSNVDILEWPTAHLVPDIVRAAINVETIGFDGLYGIDMEDFKSALISRPRLQELRVCDKMPQRKRRP